MPTTAMPRLTFTLHHSLTAWQFSTFPLLVVAGLVALGAWYLRADWKLAARGRHWSRVRTASFLSGLVAVDLALQSPIASYTSTYFQAHILQHLLLMVVGPPLLALGGPSTLLLQTASRRNKERWLAILRSKPFAVLSHPVTVWGLYYGAMYFFFLTPAIGYSMDHMALMDVVNLGFLGGATLYWWPTIGIDPVLHWKMGHGARMLNLFIGLPVETWLGIALMNESARAVRHDAPMYSLASMHSGGSILWIMSEIATAGAILPVFLQWMHSEDRKAARADARLDAVEHKLSASFSAEAAPVVDVGGMISRWEASLLTPMEPALTLEAPVSGAAPPPPRAQT
jgi:putative copper resistance protein D